MSCRYLVLSVFILFSAGVALAQTAPPAFMVEMNTEPKTIGDIKPAFLVYRNEELPKVSVEYVLKRYIKLFETAQSPDVKVDALNRINNLSAKYGLTSKKLMIDEVKQSQAVLNSYDQIVDSGVFYQRMDELLYQTAKALLFTGQAEESIKRLKLMIGLYPDSVLIDEARFRLAEAYFELGDYDLAQAEYKKILSFSETDAFHQKAKFKAAWALFKESRYDESAKLGIATLDYFPALRKAVSITSLQESEQAFAEDTIRLLSIVFSKQRNAESIQSLQNSVGHHDYAYLLYDGLFRFYLSQDRFEESAKVASTYGVNYPDQFYAYQMALNAVRSYQEGEFDILEWQEKENFVQRFGVTSHYWTQLNEEQREQVRPHSIKYLSELAHLYYVRMQAALENQADTEVAQQHSERARDYYLELAETDPGSAENGARIFLAAESMLSVDKLVSAISLYERSAYFEQAHAKSETAGYAAIRTYDRLKSEAKAWNEELDTKRIASMEMFASKFTDSPRTPDLLNALAQERFNDQNWLLAYDTAQQVLQHKKAKPKVRLASALVSAHSLFELARYDEAERAYGLAISLSDQDKHPALRQRLAASIYRQAEQQPEQLMSADLFLRMVDTVPESSFVPEALYGASVRLLEAESWSRAVATLSHFKDAYPAHEYRMDVDEKLVFALEKNGDKLAAAEQLLILAKTYTSPEKASAALYQAANYFEQEGLLAEAIETYQGFVSLYPDQFDLIIEAFDKQIAYYNEYYPEQADTVRAALVEYESGNAGKQTPRSRSLAVKARFELAQRGLDAYENAQLTLPLKQSLARKKNLLNTLVADFQAVAAYGVAEYSAAATHHIANLYRQLARDLVASERPVELTELQREQYDILLEEQAYPFEEQAMDLYQVNIARAPQGQFDDWVKQSFSVLAEMNPTEFARQPKLPEVSDAPY